MGNSFAPSLASPNLLFLFTIFLFRFSDSSHMSTSAKTISDCSNDAYFDCFAIQKALLLPQRKQYENVQSEKVRAAITPYSGKEFHSIQTSTTKDVSSALASQLPPATSKKPTTDTQSESQEADESDNRFGTDDTNESESSMTQGNEADSGNAEIGRSEEREPPEDKRPKKASPTTSKEPNDDKQLGDQEADESDIPFGTDDTNESESSMTQVNGADSGNAEKNKPEELKPSEDTEPKEPAGNALNETVASSTNVGPIIGGTLGGLAVLAVIALVVIKAMRKPVIRRAQDIDFAEVEGGGPSYLDEAVARRISV